MDSSIYVDKEGGAYEMHILLELCMYIFGMGMHAEMRQHYVSSAQQ